MALFSRKKKKEELVSGTDIDALNETKKETIVTNILSKIKEVDSEISERNEYMNERDKLLYDSDYILEGLDIKEGFDITKYNVLPRALDIHSSQVMGRGFNVVSRYDKDDVSEVEDENEAKTIQLKNEVKATKAQNAKNLVDATIRENGGNEIFKTMASVASAYGTGLIKKWRDGNRLRLLAIESVQNFVKLWSDDNFRESDGDAMIYQISVDKANKVYGKYLTDSSDSFRADEIKNINDDLIKQTSRPMTTVIEFVGIVKGINNNNPFYALIVGGHLCGYETRERFFPKYYAFQNKLKLRRPWGGSDLSDEAIDLNKSYIQKMSDYASLVNKILFPFYAAKGFEETNLPKKEQRSVQVFPMGVDQSIDPVQFQAQVYPYKDMISENKEALFRSLSLSRVFMDDPTVSFESSQALMTGMKSTIDVAEDKQARWKETIVRLLEDILEDLKDMDSNIKEVVGDEYKLDIEWPSVLRKEDASFNTTLFNDMSRGYMSLETYLEKKGFSDVQEEIDRIKSNLEDPILAAVVSGNTSMLSQVQIQQEQMEEQQQTLQMQQQPTGAPLTTDQNQEATQPASAPGSGAPAVSPQGAQATAMQNGGQ